MDFEKARIMYNIIIANYNRQRKKQDSDYEYIHDSEKLAEELGSLID
jgi:hypothetical protein